MRIEFYERTGKDLEEWEIEATRNIVDQLNEYLPSDYFYQIQGIKKGTTTFDSIYFMYYYPDENYTVKVRVRFSDAEISFIVSSTKEVLIVLKNASKNNSIQISGKKFSFTL